MWKYLHIASDQINPIRSYGTQFQHELVFWTLALMTALGLIPMGHGSGTRAQRYRMHRYEYNIKILSWSKTTEFPIRKHLLILLHFILVLSRCVQMVKIFECKVFPEFFLLSLDEELHSFSISLSIPHHNIHDKSMLPTNFHRLQMENKELLSLSHLM